MSRKDYVAIGDVLAGQWATTHSEAIWKVTLSIADVFKRDNERFDRVRFYYYVFGKNQYTARKEISHA